MRNTSNFAGKKKERMVYNLVSRVKITKTHSVLVAKDN